jgi:glycosyltransferase involved in cell wall biosynthesis
MAGPVPPPVGGASLLFRRLADALDASEEVEPVVIDTSGVRGRGPLTAAAFIALHRTLRRELQSCDVASLHVATSALHVMGPLMVWLARRHRVPLIIRKFGGTDFARFDPVRRRLIVGALSSADLYLAETHELVERAEEFGIAPAEWFPNCRPIPNLSEGAERGHEICRRFVYVGQLRRAKGVRELVAAGEELGGRAAIDVYGLTGYDIDVSTFADLRHVRYRGSVEPEDVHETLMNYDALVLPSYAEGYPGVIIEAFAAGLPVVVSNLTSISEMVDATCGVLVAPRDIDALRQGMERLMDDPEEYARLRRGVRVRREAFSESTWHRRFIAFCRDLARERTIGRTQ